jgi:outer membrane protein TolC
MLFQQGIMGGADGPITAWDIAAQLMQTIFDGGLRHAAAAAARANFQATVASYRQTVLAAFQDVEDNLIALQRLQQQLVVQKHAAADADLALRLVVNQYKAGTADYTAVLTAQVTAYTAEITANNTQYMVMTTAVGLMKAIGGCYAAGPIL